MEQGEQVSLDQQIRALLGEEPGPLLRELLEGSEAVDIARAMDFISVQEQMMLLGLMPGEKAAATLAEFDEALLPPLFSTLPPGRIAEWIAQMEPDDAADMVALMDRALSAQVLDLLPGDRQEEVRLLLTYEQDSAGGLMDPDIVQVRQEQTVARAMEDIRAYVQKVNMDDFFAVFAVNYRRQLVGAVPTWKLLLAGPDQRISEIMIPDPVSVEAHLDQEEVSRLVRDHNLVTVPVVNAHRQLIGRITVDDVVDVIEEEHHEDLGRLTGTMDERARGGSLLQTLRDRMPWLLIALVGEFFSALIMQRQQGYLDALPQLAFFIPVIMAMGGNTGMQSSALVIRGLATGDVHQAHFWRRLGRELMVALTIGLCFGGILVLGGMLLTGQPRLGLAVGLATMATITLATTAGMVIPMVLGRLGRDPALATGPFLTTMNDVLGIGIYLTIAWAILF